MAPPRGSSVARSDSESDEWTQVQEGSFAPAARKSNQVRSSSYGRKSGVERPTAVPGSAAPEVSDADTEVRVSDAVGWKKLAEHKAEVRGSMHGGRTSYGGALDHGYVRCSVDGGRKSSYDGRRDEEYEVRRSVNGGKNSFGQRCESDSEPDDGRSVNVGRKSACDERQAQEYEVRGSVNGGRRSYGQSRNYDDEPEVRNSVSGSRKSNGYKEQGPELRSSQINRKLYQTQDEEDIIRHSVKGASNGGRKSFGQDLSDEEISQSRNTDRNSYGQSRVEESQIRGSVGGGRKSYGQTLDEEAYGRRSVNGARESYTSKQDEEPEVRNSVSGSRKSYGYKEQGPELRSSQISRTGSHVGSQGEEGELRRPSHGKRSFRPEDDEETSSPTRGRNDSKAEGGAQQRMSSRPSREVPSEVLETQERSRSTKELLTVSLDPNDKLQLASIIWDFSPPGVRVKTICKACPEPGRSRLQAGDELLSISGTRVQGEDRDFIENVWRRAQRAGREEGGVVGLCFVLRP